MNRSYVLFVLITAFNICCTNDNDAKDIMEIQRMLKEERTAHLTKNASLLVSQFSNSYKEINNGRVIRFSKSEFQKGFQKYFDSVDFKAWDDNIEPEIIISTDHSMAYVIVDKHVAYTEKPGQEIKDFLLVWVSIYKKIDGKWMLDCVVSTNTR